MFAVIRTGGKQYRVALNDIIEIERIAGKPGDIVELAEVILLGGDGAPKTGSPTIAGAMVAKPKLAPTSGAFPTDGGLFVGLLIGVILIMGGLQFFPALALGPIVEHFQALGQVAGR